LVRAHSWNDGSALSPSATKPIEERVYIRRGRRERVARFDGEAASSAIGSSMSVGASSASTVSSKSPSWRRAWRRCWRISAWKSLRPAAGVRGRRRLASASKPVRRVARDTPERRLEGDTCSSPESGPESAVSALSNLRRTFLPRLQAVSLIQADKDVKLTIHI
jgi:hypothetical protein